MFLKLIDLLNRYIFYAIPVGDSSASPVHLVAFFASCESNKLSLWRRDLAHALGAHAAPFVRKDYVNQLLNDCASFESESTQQTCEWARGVSYNTKGC